MINKWIYNIEARYIMRKYISVDAIIERDKTITLIYWHEDHVVKKRFSTVGGLLSWIKE